jgi:hypothetical protein
MGIRAPVMAYVGRHDMKCIQGFDVETQSKETNWKTQAFVGG